MRVVGRRALSVSPDEALDYVAGYALMNDGSERHYQRSRKAAPQGRVLILWGRWARGW